MIAARRWLSVWLFAAAVFVVGSDAHSVAGLLPSMAASLDIPVGLAGQTVTVFAFAYAVLSPALTMSLSQLSQRRAMALALVVFAVGNAVTALAPAVAVLLAGRVIAAAGAALFTPLAAAAAAALVPRGRRGVALSIVTAGASSALVLGAPVGAAIANCSSWRITLGIIAGLGLLMSFTVWLLPTSPGRDHQTRASGMRIVLSPQVLKTLGISLLAFAGVFIPYTYMSRAYEPLIAVVPGGISTALLLFGVASVAGSLLSGPLSDHVSPRWMVVMATAGLALADVFLIVARDSPAVLAAALLIAGYLSWSILVPQQRQLIDIEPSRAAILISMNASAGYLGIAVAGVVGAVGLDLLGDTAFAVLASALLTSAALWRALPGRRAEASPQGAA